MREAETMLFSIIIPAFNAEKYIEKCIQSILVQSFQDWETIIVNDGSTDRTGEIIEKFACIDERIRVIHKQNNGQLYARRSGIEIARGEYLLFLDSDDYWNPNCLSILANAIAEYDADVIMFPAVRIGDTRVFQEYLNKISDSEMWISKAHFYSVLISGTKYNSLCLKAWRSSLFLEDASDYSKFSSVSWGEDRVQLLHPITQAQKILYIPDVLYSYTDNPSSVIHTVEVSRIPIMLNNDAFHHLYTYMKRWNMDLPEYRELIAVHYLRNYMNVYYNIRKACINKAEKRMLRKYDWNSQLSKSAFRYMFSAKLTCREKIKIILARLCIV